MITTTSCPVPADVLTRTSEARNSERIHFSPGRPHGREAAAWCQCTHQLAARGDVEQAIARYTALTTQAPLPEYLIEFGELLD
ncbi:hypothetical protein AB0M45_20885 [Nocardia sp. NPDC051787]|uniref:hypothetical protein n=1 Tax=Nocardia sp. NPDC051787 TaxID=3155415 RepID=UPI003443134A